LKKASNRLCWRKFRWDDLGKPDDVAHAVAFLASPQAGYITGQELHVNGGMFMA
jgi:NAD(P)-dependent dehydrogenase (short-subunit alcohol dehydrogenase family)